MHSPSTYYNPGTVLGAGEARVNSTKILPPGVQFLFRREREKHVQYIRATRVRGKTVMRVGVDHSTHQNTTRRHIMTLPQSFQTSVLTDHFFSLKSWCALDQAYTSTICNYLTVRGLSHPECKPLEGTVPILRSSRGLCQQHRLSPTI